MNFSNFMCVLILFFLAGCASSDQQKAYKVCTIKIEGMMCEKGCKSTIHSKIAKLDGVIDVSVDFESGVASVKFDQSLISSAAIIDMINGIAEGAYAASLIEEINVENDIPATLSEGKIDEVSVDNFSFQVPNISDLFSNIF